MKIEIIISGVSLSSGLVPLLIGLFQIRILSHDLRLVILTLSLSLLADLLLLFLWNLSINNWWIANIFLLFQVFLLYKYFSETYPNKLFTITAYLFLLFALINFIFIQGPFSFNSYSDYAGAIILLLYSLYSLYRLLKELPVENIHQLPLLWISFGVLVYYAGTLFLFLFNNYMLTYYLKTHPSVWILHNILNVIKNLLFAVALWQPYRQKM